MILKKLTLHNFGLYAKTNSFDFESERPVILIGGMNGRGKTTFLESVLLGLYGRRSSAFLESGLSYSAYLKKFVNLSDGTLHTHIELTFSSGRGGCEDEFRLRREWALQNKEIGDQVRVFKNGTEDAFLSDHWAMYIEELLPSAISGFFFFDGEKISELAVKSTDEQMRGSIKALLGIDALDRLEADLKKILSDKSKKIENSPNHRKIQELRAKEEELDLRLTSIHHDIAEINTFDDTYLREINRLEAQFMARGGTVGADRTNLLSRKHRLEEELKQTGEHLLELASAELPLTLVQPLLHNLCEAAGRERAEQNERLAVDRILQLIEDFKNDAETDIEQMDRLIRFVKSTAQNVTSRYPYHLSETALSQTKLLSDSLLRDKLHEVKQIKEHRAGLTSELAEVENDLSIEIDEAAAGSLYTDIKKISGQIGANGERRQRLEAQEAELSSQLLQTQRELGKLIEKSLSEMEKADDSARIVRYIHHALLLLSAYRLRLQEQKTAVLAQTMTDCYKQIADKVNLIDRIAIDAVTLDFAYYGANGEQVDKKRLSAGEKQLMVVAMLWALTICSHNKLPMIIDTPLARLDTVHRERMVKSYFPFAGEQTIILSTDAEIDGHYYELLKPYIGREFTLVYDDSRQSTTIKDGYFGGGRA